LTPFLSIVIPAHNEENRLPGTLEQIFRFLEKQSFSCEVLVVENGSTDNTYEIARKYASSHANLHVIQNDWRGKGLAIRRGVQEAHGEYLFFCDADLSMPIDEVDKFLPPQADHFDIAIASREVAGAVRYDEPWHRHLMGRVFNTIVRVLAVPRLQDTQCGFKMFRAEAAEVLFPLQTMDGWSFDVEILYAAQRRGYRIIEIPIHWYYKANTRIKPVRHSIEMFAEVLKIRRNGLRGLYAPARGNGRSG
jgi:glycosyltransferase involved in cell wall biosynthesis